ncbi:MAG TPA: DPP IV N-terminal domain-containing protein, partial [Flavisolibacter sp.]|nr:DPP IV N-terminal domain-containing protein [Flavisolibacter sp.]
MKMRYCFSFCLLLASSILSAQTNLAPLTVDKIMRDQKWIGASPSNPYWSADGRYLFFSWNPEKKMSDSLYYITLTDKTPKKATVEMRQETPSFNSIVYNTTKTAYAYVKNGDLYYVDAQKRERRITQTVDGESNPQFIANNSKIAFNRAQNVYAWDIATGATEQLTNFVRGNSGREAALNTQEKWLQQDAIRMSEVLQERKAKRDSAEAYNKRTRARELRSIYTEDKNVFGTVVSPDGRFVAYRLMRQAMGTKNTIIPNYVTESGFTTDINGRTKVGAAQSASEFYIFDREKDTVLLVKTDAIPGINDAPDYAKDYPVKDTTRRKAAARSVSVRGPVWNESGTKAVVEVRSGDNKDRWIMLLDAATATLKNIDRQRDEAWIAGPGIFMLPMWLDENTILYQSEATGYSHLYKADVNTGTKTPLTSGNFEVSSVQLSKDKKTIYFTSNEPHPGDYQFYRMPVNGGNREKLTNVSGINR